MLRQFLLCFMVRQGEAMTPGGPEFQLAGVSSGIGF